MDKIRSTNRFIISIHHIIVCVAGNSQGKHQPEGILGKLDDYLVQKFQGGRTIEFDVPAGVTSFRQLGKIKALMMSLIFTFSNTTRVNSAFRAF